MPKVSVIIPAYNNATYLCEAIDSVLAQTYNDFEIIIVDDGSTDDTKNNVLSYVQRYPDKIKYFYQRNKGAGSARNKGIEEAQGEYFAFLDADDFVTPEWLGKLVSSFQNNNIGACVGRVVSPMPRTLIQSLVSSKIDDMSPIKDRGNYFVGSNLMVKKIVFEIIGKFDEDFCYASEDTDFGIRIGLSKFLIAYNKEAVMFYRQRADFCGLLKQKYRNGKSKIFLYKKYNHLKKNIFQDFEDFFINCFILLTRISARFIKFIFFKKERKFILLFEHPLELLCIIFQHIGRFRMRVKYNYWL